jgi:putative hydrolase of the HAD superfamily
VWAIALNVRLTPLAQLPALALREALPHVRTMSHSAAHSGISADAPGQRPDFRDVEHWIFDLDNTLYAADATLMKTVEARICLFVQQELDLDPEGAWNLQKAYFRQYGTTLAGLMQNHGTDAESYLTFVNDVDVTTLAPDPRLVAGLARLPGKRFVFTNNCGRYAERVLEQLHMLHLFDDVWDVRRTEFRPKPEQAAYEALTRHAEIVCAHAAMFDDLIGNLEPAHRLGMQTVWLPKPDDFCAPAGFIDYETSDLSSFLHAIRIKTPHERHRTETGDR